MVVIQFTGFASCCLGEPDGFHFHLPNCYLRLFDWSAHGSQSVYAMAGLNDSRLLDDLCQIHHVGQERDSKGGGGNERKATIVAPLHVGLPPVAAFKVWLTLIRLCFLVRMDITVCVK